jgi:hypothetical protein
VLPNVSIHLQKRGALEETEEGLKVYELCYILFVMSICDLTSSKFIFLIKATFNVNVCGTITLTHLLAPSMLDRGMGHFVVVCLNDTPF